MIGVVDCLVGRMLDCMLYSLGRTLIEVNILTTLSILIDEVYSINLEYWWHNINKNVEKISRLSMKVLIFFYNGFENV